MKRLNEEQRRLVEENMALVGFTMAKYFPNTIPEREREDFESIGTIGLCKAAMGYDPEKGTFSGYAVATIRREINREFIDRYRGKRKHNGMLTLQALTEDDKALEEVLADDQPGVELLVSVRVAIEALPQFDRRVMQAALDGVPRKEIAAMLGCKRQWVEYCLNRARRSMRESVAVG